MTFADRKVRGGTKFTGCKKCENWTNYLKSLSVTVRGGLKKSSVFKKSQNLEGRGRV